MESRGFIDIANAQAHARRVDVPVTGDEHNAEDRLGAEVQRAVEGGLRVRGNDIAAFAETPADRIEEPEEQGPDPAEQIDAMDIGA